MKKMNSFFVCCIIMLYGSTPIFSIDLKYLILALRLTDVSSEQVEHHNLRGHSACSIKNGLVGVRIEGKYNCSNNQTFDTFSLFAQETIDVCKDEKLSCQELFGSVHDVFVPFNHLHFQWKSLSQKTPVTDKCLVITAKHAPLSHQVLLSAHSQKIC